MVPQRLVLDFVAPPAPSGLRRVLFALSLIAVAAGGSQLALAWQAYRHEKTELAWAAQLGAAPADTGTRRGTGSTAASLQAAGTVARDLTAPWSELLRSIESIQNKDVALQIVEPIAARQSLRITADARHFEAMLDYLEQLQGHTLAEVVLTSHQVQAQQPGAPIRFQIQAKWGAAVRDPAGAVSPARPRSAAETTAPAAEIARGPR